MSRTLITGLVFGALTIFAVFTISGSSMNPGHSNVAQAAELSKTSIAAEGQKRYESEMQQLLLERRTLLSRNVESMKIFAESGRIDVGEYRDANIALLRAEMDMCKTKDERFDILEKIIQVHKNYEEHVAKLIAIGQSTEIELNKAKVATLEAQIELIREKLKGQSHN